MSRSAEDVRRAYAQRRERFASERERCGARSRLLSRARLLSFLAAFFALSWVLESRGAVGWLLLTGLLSLSFLAFVFIHSAVRRRCERYDHLVKLNEEGLSRLARDWDSLPPGEDDAGAPPPPFADDLDLFGRASLFALLGTVATPLGRARLRTWLLEPADAGTIPERQATVKELAPLLDFREELTVGGRLISERSPRGVEGFLRWAEGEPWLLRRHDLRWAARLLPLAAFGLIALNVAGLVSYHAWAAALIVNLGVSFSVGRRVHSTFQQAFARESAFQEYAKLLERISATRFSSPLASRLRSRLEAGGMIAHRQLRRLHRLVSLSELRLSMLYLPIQALTLWDFHVLERLERWQLAAGPQARTWLEALASFDALSAIAALHFENPNWAFPDIAPTDEPPLLEARDLGHPLIADSVRVANDVRVGPPARFLFITGSNMSGKSTLLRAIGTNVVLGRAGSPVCASHLRMPTLTLETCMRVHDSLEQGLSHFMAELKRLKRVLEAARRPVDEDGSTLLYLLDDILQGTNTAERQIAARKVIQQLLKERAVGAVTSHDLALADSEELASACDAAHFSERIAEDVEGPRIHFDYKLRPGVATSRNALKLLHIVGLDPDALGGPEATARS